MRCRHSILGLVAVASLSTAHAQPVGDLCYGPPVSDAPCSTSVCELTTSSTVFDCPLVGSHTLPQLASAGWSVVSLTLVTESIGLGGGGVFTAQLVIAMNDRLFANGFDVGAGL